MKNDVLAIVQELEKDSSFNKLGLWGGSEGSCIALWAASESDKIAFVIAQSFTPVSFAEQNKHQTYLTITALANNDTGDINARMKVQALAHHYARTGDDYNKYADAVNALRQEIWFSKTLGEPMSADNKWWGWYKTKLDVVPISFLQTVIVPVLFI